jgi:hypothetical protein
VSAERPVNFGRREDLTSLYRDSLRLWIRHLPTWLAVGAAVAVPVDLIVSGIGLDRLSGPYTTPSLGAVAVDAAASYVVATPLVTAMTVAGLLEARRGRAPGALASIRAGVDGYPRLVLPVVVAAALAVAGLAVVVVGFVWLAVLFYFVPQVVMVDGRSGVRDVLRGSVETVRGSWWRVFGIAIVTGLVALLPVLVVGRPFEALAESLDLDAISLLGGMIVETLIGPWVAIVATLLYLDLRERRGERAAERSSPA